MADSAKVARIAHVVAHVVRDRRGIPGIVLRDLLLDLADEVRADVSRLRVDAAAHAREQRHERSAHAVHDHDVADLHRVANAEHVVQEEIPQRNVKDAERDDREAHDRARRERNAQSAIQSLACRLRGARIRVRRDLHADKASQKRPDAAGQKCKRRKVRQQTALRCKRKDHQNDEDDAEYRQNGLVLPPQVRVRALADRARNLLHQVSAFREGQNLFGLQKRIKPRERSADETDPEQCFHNDLSSLLFLICSCCFEQRKRLRNG